MLLGIKQPDGTCINVTYRKFVKAEWETYETIQNTCTSLSMKRSIRLKKEQSQPLDAQPLDANIVEDDNVPFKKSKNVEEQGKEEPVPTDKDQLKLLHMRGQWCALLRELWGDYTIQRLLDNIDSFEFVIGALAEYVFSHFFLNISLLAVTEEITPTYCYEKRLFLTTLGGLI